MVLKLGGAEQQKMFMVFSVAWSWLGSNLNCTVFWSQYPAAALSPAGWFTWSAEATVS